MGAINRCATATIAAGQSVSAPVYMGAGTPTGIQIPAGFAGSEISFLGSADGAAYSPVYTAAGDEATVAVSAAPSYVGLSNLDFNGMAYLEVRSGSLTRGATAQTSVMRILLQNRILGYAD